MKKKVDQLDIMTWKKPFSQKLKIILIGQHVREVTLPSQKRMTGIPKTPLLMKEMRQLQWQLLLGVKEARALWSANSEVVWSVLQQERGDVISAYPNFPRDLECALLQPQTGCGQ